MPQPQRQNWSTQEFLDWERRQDHRHELVEGEVRLMTGGTRAHNQISGNIFATLRAALRQLPGQPNCQASIADMKIVLPNGDVRYPDAAVDCAPRSLQDTALVEPWVVIEALSPSTGWYDHTQKLDDYRTLPSLRHYLLVRQDRPRAELWLLHAGRWDRSVLMGLDATVAFPAIGVGLPLRDAYDGLGYEGLS